MARRKAKGDGGGGGGSGPFTGITGTPTEVAYFDALGNGTSNSAFWVDESKGFDLFVYENLPPTIDYGAVSFSGSGIDDLTYSGTFTGGVTTTYTVTMGNSDGFTWTSDQGGSGGSTAPVTGFALDNGITISLPSTGYTQDDIWTFEIEVVNNEKGSVNTKRLSLIGVDDVGKININAPSSLNEYDLILPNEQGGLYTSVINDGSGNLGWYDVPFIKEGSNIFSINSTFPSASTGNFVVGEKAGKETINATNVTLIGQNAGRNIENIQDSFILGYDAGRGANDVSYVNFIGRNAGYGASSNTYSNFIGAGAGRNADSSGSSNFIGGGAGYGSNGSSNSEFIGFQAGENAPGTTGSQFIGYQAGKESTSGYSATFIGSSAGELSIGSIGSINIGFGSGRLAEDSDNTVFIGQSSGNQVFDSPESVFIGKSTGYEAWYAGYSVFIGSNAGYQADNATNSNFIGFRSGFETSAASYSNFFGAGSGENADTANNSIFIGNNAGFEDTVDNSGDSNDYSILLGNETSTGGFSNSIAIGQEATNTASNQLMLGSSTRPINEITLNENGDDNIVVYTRKTTVLSSDIASLNTTPITVAFGLSGKAIQIIDVYSQVRNGTTAYTSNTALQIAFDSTPTVPVWQNANVLTSTTVGETRRFNRSTGSAAELVIPGDDVVITNITGNPAGGDTAIDIWVTYKLIKM